MTRALAWLATLCAIGAAAAANASSSAPTPIFKCTLADGSVLYTDTPCAGGQALDVRAGEADRLAVERLARMQQQSSAQYARDRAAAQAADMRVGEVQRPDEGPMPAPADAGVYDPAPYSYLAPAAPPRRHHRPPMRHRQSVVPVR